MSEEDVAEHSASLGPDASMAEVVQANAPVPVARTGIDCPTCGGFSGAFSQLSFVYAIGRIESRFPLLSVEKEFSQATGRAQTGGLTDHQALSRVLTRRENRYLVRQLCWVMTVEGIETYILVPRDPADLELLVGTLRAEPSPGDIDIVVGVKGPIAPPDMCNGLTVPIVIYDQIYSFDRESLIHSIPRPETVSAEDFRATAEEVFDRITQTIDNAGATDAHRALNYLIMRYPGIYTTVLDAHARNASLSAVDVRHSALSGTRHIVEVVFSFTSRATDVTEKFFVRVDITEEFPFLISKISPYFDR